MPPSLDWRAFGAIILEWYVVIHVVKPAAAVRWSWCWCWRACGLRARRWGLALLLCGRLALLAVLLVAAAKQLQLGGHDVHGGLFHTGLAVRVLPGVVICLNGIPVSLLLCSD